MLNNRGVYVYVAMLLSAVFLILPVYTRLLAELAYMRTIMCSFCCLQN